eukprot:gnl/MRDRNA2_/MRDRNA2_260332_c0_seq1.p1 gnl/MRDRNA2_/MRDRNA2_260332_c0~~gnl/MRDRNA2_/MRDRNA2_260332_c0_seq1.p1  ORF type:complete len:176 (+),score=7.89 gnl/MRDRNA2_/MRDRNA2_260332_c0_seq1:73-528(+)
MALIMRALHGVLQEKCGRDAPASELLFIGSLLGLPFFAWKGGVVYSHFQQWNLPELSGNPFPMMWLLLLGNLIFDYCCKVSMTWLIGETSALTATMVLTMQRFVAFIISTLILNRTPGGTSPMLWLGSASILLGSLMYSTAGLKKPLVKRL